jgi:acyl carrier protein
MGELRKQASDAVMAALRETLESADIEDCEIRESTRPIEDLGLESIDGVAFACSLSQRLGAAIPDYLNPFVDDEKHKERTIGQIIELAETLVRQVEASAHE